jgi:hypothetical protein
VTVDGKPAHGIAFDGFRHALEGNLSKKQQIGLKHAFGRVLRIARLCGCTNRKLWKQLGLV